MTTKQPISCGPFDLLEPIGEGGMAKVWRGVHRAQQVPVAVKVITGSKATDPGYQERFEREVQAVAALNHPGIVTVFDYGRISALAAAADESLVEGSPYLAMEYARGGTLRGRDLVRDWVSLRAFLFDLFDALAYAHAREVVHRDIKPENILLQVEGSRLSFKLSDFGIAHAIDAELSTDTRSYTGASAGTPHYMPPEQLSGEWRDFGPCTDLYAVGCLAYELACGKVPFDDANFVRLANMHLRQPFPALEPRFPVPEQFEAFVRRLVVKEPHRRFQRAADAAFVLSQMPSGDETTGVVVAPPVDQIDAQAETMVPEELDLETSPMGEGTPTLVDENAATKPDFSTLPLTPDPSADLAELPTTHLRTVLTVPEAQGAAAGESLPGNASEERAVAPRTPPIPASWQLAGGERPSDQLVGAGLGLFGLRAIPLVDREDQRDAIWQGLREAADASDLRVISLHGRAGTGKSRLAEWMARRAHEVGAATVLKAPHAQQGGPAEGIPRMLENFFATWSLDKPAVYERVRRYLERMAERAADVEDAGALEEQARALTEILRPTSEGSGEGPDGPRFHFASLGEKHRVMRAFIAKLCRERTVICWIDDAPWGNEALGLVEHLLDEEGLPILVLLTSRTEALEHTVTAVDRLHSVEHDERAQIIELSKLEGDDHAELIRRTLRLDDELSRLVEERTQGNPLFAVQLIGDWVSRRILEVGVEGFSLRSGAASTLPRNIHDLWNQRVERLLEEFPRERRWDLRLSLELGAMFGQHVDEGEWREACRQRGVRSSDQLVRKMIEQGLATRDRAGASFAHGMLAESLREAAERAGRAAEHHLACLRTLDALYPDSPLELAARRAHHLIAAGRYHDALEPLKQAVHHQSDMGEHLVARRFLEQRQELVDRLDLPEESRARIENLWMSAQTAIPAGRANVALDNAERAARVAARHGWRVDVGHALLVKARVLRDRGEFEDALDVLADAHTELAAVDDTIGLLFAHFGRGFVLMRLAEFDDAREALTRALEYADKLDDQPRRAEVLSFLGYTFFAQGLYEEAQASLTESIELAQRLGARLSMSSSARHLGEIARYQEDWDEARRRYNQAIRVERSRGTRSIHLDELNLALVDIGDGDFEVALEKLDRLHVIFDERGLHFALPIIELALAAAAAGSRDRERFETAFEIARDSVAQLSGTDKDLGWLAVRAAELAEAAGWPEAAADVYALAQPIYEKLGEAAYADKLGDKCARLRSGFHA